MTVGNSFVLFLCVANDSGKIVQSRARYGSVVHQGSLSWHPRFLSPASWSWHTWAIARWLFSIDFFLFLSNLNNMKEQSRLPIILANWLFFQYPVVRFFSVARIEPIILAVYCYMLYKVTGDADGLQLNRMENNDQKCSVGLATSFLLPYFWEIRPFRSTGMHVQMLSSIARKSL